MDCYRLSEEDCSILGGVWHPEWLECLPSLCHPAGAPCPPGWTDCFERTKAVFLFEVPGVYEKRPIIATGPTRVLRHPAEFLRDGGGCLIETEIVDMDLSGIYDPAGAGRDRDSIAVTITLDDSSPTYGTIASSDDGAGNPDYPDTSWFNVNVLITFDGQETYPHTIDVGNLLASGDLWGDPPCVDPEGPFVSPSGDHAAIPCPEELPEGGCVLDAEIGNGCLVTSEVVCGVLAGTYLGDGTDCTGWQDVDETDGVPRVFALEILRNPSAAGVTIQFQLPRDGKVKLDIYDSSGRRVRRLLSKQVPAGTHTVAWDGRMSGGHDLAPGIYFVRLSGEHGQLARKAMILR
jgi:hypothetical protein